MNTKFKLMALLALEVALFAWPFGRFFCGDSLFYLSRRAGNLGQTLERFTGLDELQSYRPLAYAAFDYLMFPFFGLDPRGYHVLMLATHLATTVLVFALLRRVAGGDQAALAGAFVFGVHSIGFYMTYDATFTPDALLGLFGAGALYCWVRRVQGGSTRWEVLGILGFVLALLSKESAVALPLGMVALGMAATHRLKMPWTSFAVAAVYLVIQVVLRSGSLYPSQPGPYALTLCIPVLLRKVKYVAWLANFPAEWERHKWAAAPAALFAVPAIVWAAFRLREVWNGRPSESRLIAAWGLLALAPVLAITQAPMKHNLHFPVLAIASLIALSVSALQESSNRSASLRKGAAISAVLLVVSVAFQVRNDLRHSWVAEGSAITRKALDSMRASNPILPKGAIFYLLPSKIEGNVAWYFDGGGLFRVFYNDPTLEMRFADLKDPEPKRDGSRHVVVVRRKDDRFYDVTVDHRYTTAPPPDVDSLLRRFSTGNATSDHDWRLADLPASGKPVFLSPHAHGSVLRDSIMMLPGARVKFPIQDLRADSILLLGATLVARKTGSLLVVLFDEGGKETVLHRSVLAPADPNWIDRALDLGHLAGRSGSLVFSNSGPADADWISLGRLFLVRKNSVADRDLSPDSGARRVEPSLLDSVEAAEWDFDLSEKYPAYERFDTPSGTPFFLYFGARPKPSLVTLSGARVRLPVTAIPKDSQLQVATGFAGVVGDGAVGRLFWQPEGSATRELLVEATEKPDTGGGRWRRWMRRIIGPPGMAWTEHRVDLRRLAGQRGRFVFECASGPARNTINDWFAWGDPRMVTVSPPAP